VGWGRGHINPGHAGGHPRLVSAGTMSRAGLCGVEDGEASTRGDGWLGTQVMPLALSLLWPWGSDIMPLSFSLPLRSPDKTMQYPQRGALRTSEGQSGDCRVLGWGHPVTGMCLCITLSLHHRPSTPGLRQACGLAVLTRGATGLAAALQLLEPGPPRGLTDFPGAWGEGQRTSQQLGGTGWTV
jgi:hypothetical protein